LENVSSIIIPKRRTRVTLCDPELFVPFTGFVPMDRLPFLTTSAAARYAKLRLPVVLFLHQVRSMYNVGAFCRSQLVYDLAMKKTLAACLFLFAGLTAGAAEPLARFVEVGDGVRIEVLDWGGAGRPVILLAGSGDTGHVFEDFAPKLADCCHVYAITRRGYGMSSKPERGYSVPELAEDIWRVIESLKIAKPVVVGHSMAGSELTFLGQKHSPDLAGLVYLDANGDPMDWPWSNEEYRRLVMKSMKSQPPPPSPTTADKASVDAFRDFQKRTRGFPLPAGEIRAMYEIQADGSVGKNRTASFVSRAIDAGSIPRDYRGITAPVLALFPVPLLSAEKWKDRVPKDEQERIDSDRIDEIFLEFVHRWQGSLKQAVPEAHIVDLPGAHHYLFQDEEMEVLRELRKFLSGLDSH
jgi:non-heme chloroperoxidase